MKLFSTAVAQTPRDPNAFGAPAPAWPYAETTTQTTAETGFGTPQSGEIDFGTSGFETSVPTGIGELALSDLIQLVVVYAFIIAAVLSAVFIFVGGINFILSGGNDEKIKRAVNTIRYSIIGLIISILSFTFVTIIGRIFGLNFLDYLSYDSIRASVNRLVQSADTTTSGDSTFAP